MHQFTQNMSGSCFAARTRISNEGFCGSLALKRGQADAEDTPERIEAGDVVLG